MSERVDASVLDEGIARKGYTLDFVGAGVTVTSSANKQTVSIPGGGSDPWTTLILASDFTTTSNTAVDITGLGFAPVASTKF